MKCFQRLVPALAALLAAAGMSASAETRMQTAAAATIWVLPSAISPQVGHTQAGEILSVLRTEGDWAAISPPDRLSLWINKDFIEGNQVIAKSIQIRSGPGIQNPIVGTLTRGAAVSPRGEEGDWCKIAPPGSITLWIMKKDLTAANAPAPAPVPVPAPPVATPAPSPQPAPTAPVPPVAKPVPPPAPQPVARPSAPAPAPRPAVPVSHPAPASAPAAAAPKPSAPVAVSAPVPAPRPVIPAPAPSMTPAPAKPALRPATAIPASPASATNATLAKPRPPAKAPLETQAVPVPASALSGEKSQEVDVAVDQALVDQLDLADMPNQGKPVQVEGELRNAPLMAASPSRFRLQARNADNILEMICHVHGDSQQLRMYVGKGVSIRGREYWVEESDMPVVVVGQIVPLAPASEPVMF